MLAVVRRRWRWLTAVTLLCVLGAVLWATLSTPSYRATGRVFFSLEYGDSASDLVQGSNYTQGQVASFAELVDTPAVLQPVIDGLALDLRPAELARQVDAAAPVDTVLIEVSVTDTSPARSAAVANAVIDSLSVVVEDLAPSNAQGVPTVRATTVAGADVPSEAASPDLLLAMAVGLFGGLVAGIGAAAARDGLDNRVRDADVVRQLTDVPIIGALPTRAHRSDPPMVVEVDPHGAHAEAFRLLRTNLQFVDVPSGASGDEGGVRVIAVTSSLPAEGKSTIAANLAAALAETGVRVLLVDADLRRPSVATILGLEGAVGLTTVLLGRVAAADVIQAWGSSGLHVLPSGLVPPNPSELLGSPAMRSLVAELRRSYDYVVLDTAPLLAVADAAILSRVVDGTLLVGNVSRVRRHQFAEALEALGRVDARVLGVALNQVRREPEAYSYEPTEGSEPGLARRPSRPKGPAAPLPRRPGLLDLPRSDVGAPLSGGTPAPSTTSAASTART